MQYWIKKKSWVRGILKGRLKKFGKWTEVENKRWILDDSHVSRLTIGRAINKSYD